MGKQKDKKGKKRDEKAKKSKIDKKALKAKKGKKDKKKKEKKQKKKDNKKDNKKKKGKKKLKNSIKLKTVKQELPKFIHHIAPEKIEPAPEPVISTEHSSNYNVKDALLILRQLTSIDKVEEFTKDEARISITRAIPPVIKRLEKE